MLLPVLNTIPLSPTQHGYQAARSMTTALLPLVSQVAQSFDEVLLERTVTMAIDLSKAFDMVNHTELIAALNTTHLNHSILRWLYAYLKGRVVCCRYGDWRLYSLHPQNTSSGPACRRAPASPLLACSNFLFRPSPRAFTSLAPIPMILLTLSPADFTQMPLYLLQSRSPESISALARRVLPSLPSSQLLPSSPPGMERYTIIQRCT